MPKVRRYTLTLGIGFEAFGLELFSHSQERESFDDAPFQKMLFNNLRHVLGFDLCVPDAVRINEDGCADCAEADRSAISQDDAAVRVLALFLFAEEQLALYQFALKSCPDLGAAHSRTGFPVADKDVMANGSVGHGSQGANFIFIFDE